MGVQALKGMEQSICILRIKSDAIVTNEVSSTGLFFCVSELNFSFWNL